MDTLKVTRGSFTGASFILLRRIVQLIVCGVYCSTVGENTYPNIVALLSGITETEMKAECLKNARNKHLKEEDFCPWIWKLFAEANYATSYSEDRVDIAMFNFKKTGFVKKPVDFYLRPFMLGVYYHEPYHQNFHRRPKV